MAVEHEGISVEISANAQDFVGGIGQAISSLTGFRAATAAAAGATAVAFGVKAVQTFASYETALENVRQVHGLSGAQIADAEKRMRDFGRTTLGATTSQKDLAAAMATVAQRSRDLSETETITKAAAALTATKRAGATVVENAQTLNDVLEATGRSGEEALHVANVLLAVRDAYGGSVADIAGDLSATNAKAKEFNLSLEEQAAIIGVLSGKRIDAKQLFSGLAQFDVPGGTADQGLKERFGFSAFESDGSRKSLQALAEDLNFVIAATGDSESAFAELSAVLGDRAALALLVYAQSLGEVALAQESIGTSAGVVAESVRGHSETTQSEIEKFKANLADIGTAVGEPLAKAINDLFLELPNFGPFLAEMQDFGRKFAGVFEGLRLGAALWVENAKNWLVNLGPNIVAGIKDFSADLWARIKPSLDAAMANVRAFLADITNTVTGYTPPIPTVPHRSALGGMTISDPMDYPLPPMSQISQTGQTPAIHITNATINLPSVQNPVQFAEAARNEFVANYGTQSARRSTG